MVCLPPFLTACVRISSEWEEEIFSQIDKFFMCLKNIIEKKLSNHTMTFFGCLTAIIVSLWLQRHRQQCITFKIFLNTLEVVI